ncbi:MAG: fatty acid desaturase [Gammaproteobacteria bacterium]|nr:fatty acid desaturase [Gammaproteobacteria bacterium]
MTPASTSTRETDWVVIIFFAFTTLVGLVGAPLYVASYGLTGAEVALFAFFLVITPVSITVGYHRLFSHGAWKTNRVIRFLLLFFGAAAFEQSALEWTSQHRDHHRYVDTDRDPYSIKKGFFYAHIGWMMFWRHRNDYDNVRDLARDPLVMHQHRHYLWWALIAGVATPLAIGAATGYLASAFILAVCLRIAVVHHLTFFINSICHMYGKATYDIHASAKDNWLIAFLTFGEGYHNFHHRFAADYRNGVRWYQWDPSKWIIAGLAKVGLASDLRRVSDFSILAAELAGEHTRVSEWLSRVEKSPELTRLSGAFKAQYDKLKHNLAMWEAAAREHGGGMQRRVAGYSDGVRKSAAQKLAEAQRQFEAAHDHWKALLRQVPVPV